MTQRTLEEELQDYKNTCEFLINQSCEDVKQLVYLEDAVQEILKALKDCIGDLEYTESDGWMSGQVHANSYKDALAIINKYKDVGHDT